MAGPIDPRKALIGLDANALDRRGRQDEALADRFRALAAAGRLKVLVPGGVEAELRHPRGPLSSKADVPQPVPAPAFVRRPGLTAAQHISRLRIRAMVQGNARPGKHEADAAHLSEAHEAGCAYFITYDGRLLRKRQDLEAALPGLAIVTLEGFFEILADFEGEQGGDATSE